MIDCKDLEEQTYRGRSGLLQHDADYMHSIPFRMRGIFELHPVVCASS